MNPLLLLKFAPWVLLGLSLVWGTYQGFKVRDLQVEFSEYKAEAADKQAQAIEQALEESRRLQKVQDDLIQDTQSKLTKARNDAAAAGSVASRLRDQLAKYRPAETGDSCAAERNEANRLSIVFGECNEEYRAVARAADEAIVKALAVEKAYESVRQQPSPPPEDRATP